MRTYQGSGFPCRRGRKVCRWRVMPATGDPENLRTAAWDRVRHEKVCPFPDAPATVQPREERPAAFRSIDEAATFQAARDVDEERDWSRAEAARGPRFWDNPSFNVRCKVCGKRFQAKGPRTAFCSECRAAPRKVPQ